MLDLTHPQNFASLHRLNHVSLGFEQLQQAAGAGQMAGAYHEQGGGLLHDVGQLAGPVGIAAEYQGVFLLGVLSQESFCFSSMISSRVSRSWFM